jgi:hypothetical protein
MQINRQSYEEYFLLYADGELNESEKKAVEEFIDQNPDLAGEMSLIQETVFKPDGSIIFENKELLFKDSSNERKIIYARWFRMAAAAALLIAFSVVGWVFLGDTNMHREPVAIVKPPEVKNIEHSDVVSSDLEKKQPVQRLADEKKQTGKEIPLVAQPEKKEANKSQHPANHEKNTQPGNSDINNEPGVVNVVPPSKTIESATFIQDAVKPDGGRETIDVAVEPRAIENNNDDQPPGQVSYAQSFSQESDDDMIYFANTTLTKKTRLRGVFRKATRYLDRVTSLQ